MTDLSYSDMFRPYRRIGHDGHHAIPYPIEIYSGRT